MYINAPVAVFSYTRLEHLIKTLNALNEADSAENTDLFVFCDNYRKESEKEKVNAVRNYVDSFAKNNKFKNVTVIKSCANKGLKKSIIEGVSQIINKYGKIIVVEDDLITQKDFLVFMNQALEYYEKNKKIWAISGYTFSMKSLENYSHDVYFTGRGCSWGWATWANRWNSIDWSVADYGSFKYNVRKRRQFAEWGADLPAMLDGQMISDIDSWAITWCYEAFKQGKLTVYPKHSLIKNIGNDGSGVHGSISQNDFASVFSEKKGEYIFESPFIDNKVKKEFANRFCYGFTNKIKVYVKSLLRRLGIYTIIKNKIGIFVH